MLLASCESDLNKSEPTTSDLNWGQHSLSLLIFLNLKYNTKDSVRRVSQCQRCMCSLGCMYTENAAPRKLEVNDFQMDVYAFATSRREKERFPCDRTKCSHRAQCQRLYNRSSIKAGKATIENDHVQPLAFTRWSHSSKATDTKQQEGTVSHHASCGLKHILLRQRRCTFQHTDLSRPTSPAPGMHSQHRDSDSSYWYLLTAKITFWKEPPGMLYKIITPGSPLPCVLLWWKLFFFFIIFQNEG